MLSFVYPISCVCIEMVVTHSALILDVREVNLWSLLRKKKASGESIFILLQRLLLHRVIPFESAGVNFP